MHPGKDSLAGAEDTDKKMPEAVPVDSNGMVIDPKNQDIKGAAAASYIDLPYRMIFAVATHNSIVLYDTQQASPICMATNLHYHSFTDLSW